MYKCHYSAAAAAGTSSSVVLSSPDESVSKHNRFTVAVLVAEDAASVPQNINITTPNPYRGRELSIGLEIQL